jgi:hypothetical protein
VQIRLFNSSNNNYIALRFIEVGTEQLIMPFMVGDDTEPELHYQIIQKIGSTETIVAQGFYPDGEYRLSNIIVDGSLLKLYINSVLWRTVSITPMTVNRLELSGGAKKFLVDEMFYAPYAAKESELEAWHQLERPFFDPDGVVFDEKIPSASKWDSKVTTFYEASQPSANAVGDIWYDTSDNNHPYRWDGNQWVDIQDKSPIPDDRIPSADKWDQKARTFYQDTPPVASGIGDIWINTADYNHLYRWSGTQWLDANNHGPHNADDRPISAGGGNVVIDDRGAFGYDAHGVMRAGFGTDGRWIAGAGAVTADELGIMIKDIVAQELRLMGGNISGLPWGDEVLAPGTYGWWGDRAGVFLRGYARLLVAGSAEDEEIIDLSEFANLSNPEILVAPKELVSYSPHRDTLSHLYVDAVKLSGEAKYVVKAKTMVKGNTVDWGGSSETYSSWSFTRPTGSVEGKKGVYTDFFICRPKWRVANGGLGLYTARLYMDITDKFSSNGDPINWETIRSFSQSSSGSGTLNWDTALPRYGQWALRVRGEGGGAVLVKYAFTELDRAGYRTGDTYLNVDGDVIQKDDPANYPSGMSAIYFVFDKG